MDDVWFGRDATHADAEACLDALALQRGDRSPLVVVASGNEPRLILASRALFSLFGAASADALSDRLLSGHDPGSRRLGTLCRTLATDGAPRLERLRFFLGPGTEMITFLCRRIPTESGPRFVAAALGVRPGLMASPAPMDAQDANPPPVETTDSAAETPMPAMSIQQIQVVLRERWPASRTMRFLWQSNVDMVCTHVTPPLGEIVGAPNADLVGRDLMALAPQIDPSGRLAEALARRATWSGVDVAWPIADTPAAVAIGLGAIPVFERDRSFEGYSGYGVIHLDKVTAREPLNLSSSPAAATEPAVAPTIVAAPAVARPPRNVVSFPGGRTLSPEEQQTFSALGAELREDAGLGKTGLRPLEPPPPPAPPVVATPVASDSVRAEGVAQHGLAILDRLAVGILVSRDNVPIFANRHLLDTLGFDSEDALHDAGGLTHLFGDQPGNVSGSEAVGIRHRDGHILHGNARMQTIDWDGLPATLLTLWQVPTSTIVPVPTPETATPGASEPTAVMPELPAVAADKGADEIRELRAILETATDGVVVIDGDGNVTSLNRSGEALLGRDRGTVIGKPFLDLFTAHNQGLVTDYLDGLKSDATKRLLNDGREFEISADRNQTIPVFMTLGRLGPSTEDEGPTPAPRFCALFRDLTHWKKVERDLEVAKQEAEHANALKSDFLAKVSHEVRTPLNAIIGFADVMMEERFGPVGNARYKDYLRDIHASGTHVMSLVNDLLDLSKIEAGKMELKVETIDANKIIGECVAIMQPQASQARVIMRLSLAPALPQIKADERSLRQIVLNLLSNAVKFNEPGGQVIVATATPETGHVVMRIRDTGPGMSEADISAALEPFRQLPTSRPASTNGTGLGLPLTKALVEANQATLSIRSKVDQGTLVEVSFPPARVMAR